MKKPTPPYMLMLIILLSFMFISMSYAGFVDTIEISGTATTSEDFNYTELVGYWKFDEGTGTTAFDSSAYSNDGTVRNGASWTMGKIGSALDFDGYDDFVEIMDDESLDVTDEITIMAWVKPDTVYYGGDWMLDDAIVCKRSAYFLNLQERGKLRFYAYGLNPESIVGSNISIYEDEWVHVAAVYDEASITLYVNGEIDNSIPSTGSISTSNDPLRIGYTNYNRYFDGIIDEVKIYETALTAEEIQYIYNEEK